MATVNIKANTNLTVKQNLEDFEFALGELESSYAGFDIYVNDSTRSDYDLLVQSLRSKLSQGTSGWEAALELYSWFDDAHLGLVLPYREQEKYLSPRRLYNSYPEIEPYEPSLVAKEVSSKTFIIRLPEFDDEMITQEWTDSVVNVVSNSSYDNIIIDLRGNEGGDETIWHPILSLVYDHPGTVKSVEYRKSPHNVAYLQSLADEFPETQMILDKFNQNPEKEYALLTDTEDILIDVLPNARRRLNKIAFIVDSNVASAAEALLLQAKAISNRVIIYGKENTNGSLDCASVREDAVLPNSQITLTIPICRTYGLPDNGIDRTGIIPDVRITLDYPSSLTDNLDEWTIWIASELEK